MRPARLTRPSPALQAHSAARAHDLRSWPEAVDLHARSLTCTSRPPWCGCLTHRRRVAYAMSLLEPRLSLAPCSSLQRVPIRRCNQIRASQARLSCCKSRRTRRRRSSPSRKLSPDSAATSSMAQLAPPSISQIQRSDRRPKPLRTAFLAERGVHGVRPAGAPGNSPLHAARSPRPPECVRHRRHRHARRRRREQSPVLRRHDVGGRVRCSERAYEPGNPDVGGRRGAARQSRRCRRRATAYLRCKADSKSIPSRHRPA